MLRLRRICDRAGFTIIEVLIVVAILGILAAIAVPSFTGVTDKGNTSACKADLASVRTASEAYYAKNSSYATAIDDASHSPTTLIGARLLSTVPSSSKYTITYSALDGSVTGDINDPPVTEDCSA